MTGTFQIQRRPWLVAVGSVFLLLIGFVVIPDVLDTTAGPLATRLVPLAPVLAFGLLLVVGVGLDFASSRAAAFLNPLAQAYPVLALLFLRFFGGGGEVPIAAAIGLCVVTVPCVTTSAVTAFLYWRDIRTGTI